MGQKANIITLRLFKTNLNIVDETPKNLIHILEFLKIFNFYLQKKNVYILKTSLKSFANICTFKFELFFLTKKCNFYKKKIIKKSSSAYCIKSKKFLMLFSNFFKSYKKNLYQFKFINLNIQINKELLVYCYNFLKKFKIVIFSRRYNLFIDFIKATTLLCQNKLSSSAYLMFLSLIFKFLAKKVHTKFFSFIREVCNLIIKKVSKILIKGISFKINGKLKGKPRAGSFLIVIGQMPNQTINANIDFAFCHTYTRLGVFGMHLCIYK